MKEIWKPVLNWENLYEVSNLGNVRSLHYKKPYQMRPVLDAKGYLRVSLVRKNSKKYTRCGVHRLVAQAFIPNPNNLPQVNHKDENKQNNQVDNLEWCTTKYNCNYGNYSKKVRNSRLGIKFSDLHIKHLRDSHSKTQGKPVVQLDEFGNIKNKFSSLSEASRELNIAVSCISLCCKGKIKSAGGFIFVYDIER